MDTIFAYKLFKDKNSLNNIELEGEKHITVDFSRVKDCNLQNIQTLLNLQKIAIFNDVKLDIKNTTPLVEKMLYQTGLYKTWDSLATNPIIVSKRLNFS